MDDFKPAWRSPPGDTVSDLLEERGLDPSWLEDRLGLTTTEVLDLLSGTMMLDADLAYGLSVCFGSPAAFWLRREADYREPR